MKLATALEQLAELLDASTAVVDTLQAIRDGYSDDAFERLEEEHPLVAALLDATAELEDRLGA